MKSLATYAICCPIHSKQNVRNDLINLKKVTLILSSGCLHPKIKIAFLSDIVTSVTAYSFSVRFFNSFIVNFFLQKWLKTHKLQVIRNKKSIIKIDIFKTILKILKNVKPTLKVKKINCNRLQNRGKHMKITHAFFRGFGCSIQVVVKNGSYLKASFHLGT